LARQNTNEYKIYGDPDTFQYIINTYNENYDGQIGGGGPSGTDGGGPSGTDGGGPSGTDRGGPSGTDRGGPSGAINYQKVYELADYIGLSKHKLDQRIIEKTIYQLPFHLIEQNLVQQIPAMLLNYRGQVQGKEVCPVYALDIDTTLSSDEIHQHVNQIGNLNLNEESTQIFKGWISRSNPQQLEWLFEYRKTPILMDFIRSHANKYNVDHSLIGFYLFQQFGENYIRKINQEVAIQQILEKWITHKPALGGNTARETWLMLHVYIGFRVIESKSTLHFYRNFDKAKVCEDTLGNQWIDTDMNCLNLLDPQDLAFIFVKKSKL